MIQQLKVTAVAVSAEGGRKSLSQGWAPNWLTPFQMVSPAVVFTQVTLRNWEGWAYIYVQVTVNDIEKEQRGVHGEGNYGEGKEGEMM